MRSSTILNYIIEILQWYTLTRVHALLLCYSILLSFTRAGGGSLRNAILSINRIDTLLLCSEARVEDVACLIVICFFWLIFEWIYYIVVTLYLCYYFYCCQWLLNSREDILMKTFWNWFRSSSEQFVMWLYYLLLLLAMEHLIVCLIVQIFINRNFHLAKVTLEHVTIVTL